MKAASLWILSGLCLLLISPVNAATFTKHFRESIFKITEKGLFSVEILMDDKEYSIGKNVIGIVIHDARDEDVEGAELSIVLTDGEGRDISPAPVVREKGGGLYTVANVDIRRAGKWTFRITAKRKKDEDSATFVFPDVLEKRMPHGKHD